MNKKGKTLKEDFIGAVQSFKKKDFKNAEIVCYKILSIDPNHFDSISLLATISAVKGDYVNAKELIIKALEIRPKDTGALNNLGTAYKELGEPKEATNIYKKVLTINPNHTNANYNLGLLFFDLRELKIVKSYFQKAVGVSKNHERSFFCLGNVHAALKETKDAVNCYQKAIEINPNLPEVHNNLGLTFRDLNDFQNAENCYKKSVEIKPDHAPAYHNLAQLYKELGEFDKAIKFHQMATKYEPEDLTNYFFISELKKEIIDLSLRNKIEKTLAKSNPTIANLAYGNYLLAKYERKTKNYEKEINYLIKGHQSFYLSNKKKFDLGIKYCFDDVHQIVKGGKVEKSDKKIGTEIKPIFIVGVPRCGSTLVERIIGSGKKTIPIGEETTIVGHFIPSKVLEKQSLNLGNVANIRNELSNIYKEKGLVSKENNYTFTDKSLDNFFYLKLIKEIYPNAKIINCNRDALSSIMSIFQNNLSALAWTHDLDNIFKYFDNYFEIIKRFNKANPNIIYELKFEKLINNPEEESKKLMNYCELPWDKRCLEFYKRKDLFSKTASNIQVRKPIYKQPSDRYLPYKEYLYKYGKKYPWFN